MSNIEYANEDSVFNKRLLPNGVIHWSQAKNHINEKVSVYGEVASTYFNWDEYERWTGYPEFEFIPPPTFIEIGAKFPNKELLKLVIWGRDWGKFQRPPDIALKDTAVIVTGSPYIYKDIVTIQVSDPACIQTVSPIPCLYEKVDAQKAADPDYVQVFTITAKPSRTNNRSVAFDEPDDYYDDYDRGYHEYEDDSGHEVTRVGDYFYDDEGNCVVEVHERSPYEWHHSYYGWD